MKAKLRRLRREVGHAIARARIQAGPGPDGDGLTFTREQLAEAWVSDMPLGRNESLNTVTGLPAPLRILCRLNRENWQPCWWAVPELTVTSVLFLPPQGPDRIKRCESCPAPTHSDDEVPFKAVPHADNRPC